MKGQNKLVPIFTIREKFAIAASAVRINRICDGRKRGTVKQPPWENPFAKKLQLS
jgi:hypothetical protein